MKAILTTLDEKIPYPPLSLLRGAALALFSLCLFFFALEVMAGAFRVINQDVVQQLLLATSNPFVGLFIGILVTSIVQSSSTITSMLVAMMVSGTLDLAHAVPIVMGANIGTTVTSTIVAMSHIKNRNEFRKAIVGATMHDLFNIIVVAILFPLEYTTGFLSQLSQYLSSGLMPYWNPVHTLMQPLQQPMMRLASWLLGYSAQMEWAIILLAVLALFFAIKNFASLINKLLIGHAHERMLQYFFSTPLSALLWGTLITGTVQSSSVTTSLMVPLVAKDKIDSKRAFCFVMGANLGTTVTALFAAFSISPLGLSVALAHLLFNLIGVLLIFPIPAVRYLPVTLARHLGIATEKNRLVGFLYLLFTFFLIPFLLIYFTR